MVETSFPRIRSWFIFWLIICAQPTAVPLQWCQCICKTIAIDVLLILIGFEVFISFLMQNHFQAIFDIDTERQDFYINSRV